MRRHRKFKVILLLSGLMFIFGCSNPFDQADQSSTKMEKEVQDRTLVLYNWEEYIGTKTLENFEKETGIHVKEINFQDEEEMLGAVQSELGKYDLVVASDDLIREMREARLLAQLNISKIPNIKYIDTKYLNRDYDPEQKYSIPYLTGTTGMVVNKKYIKDESDSWKVLFNETYKGKLAMLNNSWEVISVAAKLQGNSINVSNQAELDQAMKMCAEQKPILQGYLDVITIKQLLIEEKLWAAEIYSGEGLAAVDENENLEYVIPKEGAAIWVDSFALLRDAAHPEEAHIFLNYILRPDVNAAIASELWYATPNKAAIALMDAEVAQSPSVYPSPEIIARCEFFQNTGDFTPHITRAWAELMASK